MGYVEENLMSGEQIVARASLHWIGFLGPASLAFLGLTLLPGKDTDAGIGAFIFAAIWGSAAFMTSRTSEFAVTNKRVLMKVGWIRRTSLEVLLTKVEGIQVHQGMLGRLLGYGSIVVSGTGGSKDPFHRIADPLGFRKKVQEQIEAKQA